MEPNKFDRNLTIMVEEMLPFNIQAVEEMDLIEDGILMKVGIEHYCLILTKIDKEDYEGYKEELGIC